MGRQVKGLLYFYFAEGRFSLMVFWAILMSVVIVILPISFLIKDVEGAFMSLSLTGPMYIYCAVYGFLQVKEGIPYSIKMGATRKSIMVSMGLFFLTLSVSKAVVGNTLHVLIELLNKQIGIENFRFLHLAYFLEENTWLNRVIIDSSIMFMLFALLFAMGLLFYRFGLTGGGLVLAAMIIVLLIGAAQGWLIDFIVFLSKRFDLLLFGQIALFGLVIYLLSLLLVRRITTVKVR